jgi:hypothetical protein
MHGVKYKPVLETATDWRPAQCRSNIANAATPKYDEMTLAYIVRLAKGD